MTSKTPKAIYLKDYQPPAYLVDTVALTFDLFEDHCRVTSQLSCRSNPVTAKENAPFVCFGENLELLSIQINDQAVAGDNMSKNSETLTIHEVPSEFRLEIVTKILPQKNKALQGLYKSRNMFCTQCEAEGFRRITYFPDKPDILSVYSTKIIADQTKYPVLLSNGNPIEQGELKNGRHWIRWVDPFKKPSYLFALVAGDLVALEDSFTTRSGKDVVLKIYVEKENEDKCAHAMDSLKKSMLWDEEVYGREYDLDIFMIVAVDDFNAGAMENKGLNIFNSSLVLARPDNATDDDYERIQGVVAHEYFHNWTGNRITCRDWFQLSLKEGLTVYRDQEFSADMNSKATKRIADVNIIRSAQFAEDSGPMAHQVRPDSYIEINNFYTLTIYHKGAELIRMIAALLGEKAFFKGMELYFNRHDGQAVTTEDFVLAMENANNVDLKQFRRWYTQAGTPEIIMSTEYNQKEKTFSLTFEQSCPPTPGQEKKDPFHIPIITGLLGENGKPFALELEGANSVTESESITLELKRQSQTFIFKNVPVKPVPSVLRNFSAPVKLHHDLTQEDLLFLMSNDTDPFNRWEAGQQILTRTILNLVEKRQQKQSTESEFSGMVAENIKGIVNAYRLTLNNKHLEKQIISQTLSLPGETYLTDQMEIIDVDSVHFIRESVKKSIAQSLKSEFLDLYNSLHNTDSIEFSAKSSGIRSLKNLALEYLMVLDDPEINRLCLSQFENAKTMTDELKALTFIVNEDLASREHVLNAFYQKWNHDTVVMNKWLMIQSASKRTGVEAIKKLLDHSIFNIQNPNKVRALIGTFASSNLVNFHQQDGSGYVFLSNCILTLDKINPQIASRLLTPFTRWKKFDSKRQNLIKDQLERISKAEGISKDVYEITSKSLV